MDFQKFLRLLLMPEREFVYLRFLSMNFWSFPLILVFITIGISFHFFMKQGFFQRIKKILEKNSTVCRVLYFDYMPPILFLCGHKNFSIVSETYIKSYIIP